MGRAAMHTYRFTYSLSGTDLHGNGITRNATYSMEFRASRQDIAERKLRGHYYQSVQVNIQSCVIVN